MDLWTIYGQDFVYLQWRAAITGARHFRILASFSSTAVRIPPGPAAGHPPASISASAALNSCRSWSSDIPYRCCSSSSIGCNQHQLVKIKQKEAYPYRQKSDTPNSDAYGKRLGFLGGHISKTSRFTSASKKEKIVIDEWESLQSEMISHKCPGTI